jgi:RHS repeat-associated protein
MIGTNGAADFTNEYQYDSLGDMTQVSQSGSGVTSKQANFSYNGNGQLTELDLSSGSAIASAAYAYDQANRLTSLTWTRSSDSSTINAYSFAYDSNDQITSETNSDGSIAYTYDHDGQLTGATGTGLPSSQSYSYDATGNQTAAGDSTGTDNQLTSDGTYDYAYDADGNLITKTTIATGATENFTWDYRNRLTEITYKNSAGTITGTVQYTYDPLNRRISQTVTNGSGTVTLNEHYIYDGNALVLVLDGSGNVTHTFLNGPAANQPLADDAGSGNVTWMLADQQGTVRDVINSSGSLVDHIVYDSYGNIVSQTTSANQPRFTYAGMQLDSATGLYFDHARYYDATTGRFLSQDPTTFRGGNVNLYDYVNNDPANLIDPAGLSPSCATGNNGNSGRWTDNDPINPVPQEFPPDGPPTLPEIGQKTIYLPPDMRPTVPDETQPMRIPNGNGVNPPDVNPPDLPSGFYTLPPDIGPDIFLPPEMQPTIADGMLNMQALTDLASLDANSSAKNQLYRGPFTYMVVERAGTDYYDPDTNTYYHFANLPSSLSMAAQGLGLIAPFLGLGAALSSRRGLIPPPARDIQAVANAVNSNANDLGIGIVDTQTGQIYLSPASVTPSHLDLASQALGIEDVDAANDLRGFSVGKVGNEWQFANNSSLNPVNNEMEPELFDDIKQVLLPELNGIP